MEAFYTILALLTAGVSLMAGLTNVIIGLHKGGERAELFFGLMALSLFVFLLIPPLGFILVDKAPYTLGLEIKRIFIWSYYIILPWYLESYSGYKNRFFNYSILVIQIIAYIFMISARVDSMKPLWVFSVLVVFGLILWQGLIAAAKQMKSKQKIEGKWLLWAMIIYGILFALTAINQLGNNYFGNMLGTKLFFPFHLQQIAFLVIMSIRLHSNAFERYRLEKLLRWSDRRWNSLVQDMHLLIVELDRTGCIQYLNPYAAKALGLGSESEYLNMTWFDHFIPKEKIASNKSLFLEAIRDEKMVPYFTSSIVTKEGSERIINWTNVFVYDKENKVKGTMNIGLDITEQENAFEQIRVLKDELEKENFLLKEEQHSDGYPHDIIGHSESILYAIQKARQVSTTHAAVLLEGETGSGKELFANLIHENSYRNNKPYIKINCAALPPELIESELFGHEKGSFTGALQSRRGRFELAHEGTIFLDEIGELPLTLQPKLLRVLQSGEFERIGGQQTIKVDVRVISATNRDLNAEVKAHRFREDLYYRLNVFPITIPPLRNRKEDIPILLTYYVTKISTEHRKHIENISKADMTRLCEYSWPGNVRELINMVERSIISSSGLTLKLSWPHEHNGAGLEQISPFSIEEIDKSHILKVLKACNWKINGQDGAAVKLGLNPNTLRSRLKKLNIARSQV